MRKAVAFLVFLGLVAASLLWPHLRPSEEVPPRPEAPAADDAPTTGTIEGRVTRHGYPAVADITVKRIRDVPPTANAGREGWDVLWILIEPDVGTGAPVATATSAEDGTFAIAGLPPAEYDVVAQTADGATRQGSVKIGAPGEIVRNDFEIGSAGHTLLGRLSWSDGRPFRGRVAVGQRGTETAPDGRFVLADLWPEPAPVTVYQAGVIRRQVAEYLPGGDSEIDVVVDAGLVWREGRVLSADDEGPIGGAKVLASRWLRQGRWCSTTTSSGPDGRFRLPAHPGCEFSAGGDDHLTGWAEEVSEDGPVTIRLRRRPVVTGRVVTEDGRTVPGAPLWLLDLPDHADGRGDIMWDEPPLTDAEGGFRIASPTAGCIAVFAFGGGYISRDLPLDSRTGYNALALDLEPGQTVDSEIVVVPTPSVAGRVTDHEGNPVPGLRAYAHYGIGFSGRAGWTGGWMDIMSTAVTGRDGTYRIPSLFPGLPLRVVAFPPVGATVESDEIAPEGEATVDLVMPRPPHRQVEVRVLSADDGRPIPGALVTAMPAPEENGEWPEWYGGSADTGPDGRTLLGPLPPGPLFIPWVSHPAHIALRGIPVPGSESDAERLEVTVRLDPGGVLAGRILSPDGSPAAGAQVNVERRDGPHDVRRTGADGGFAFRDLEPGRYRVYTMSDEVVAETGREDLVLRFEPRPPPRVAEEEGPLPEGRVSGRVLDPDGAPVRGARVDLRFGNDPLPEDRPRPRARTTVWTGADGAFAFTGVGDEPRYLAVDGPPHLFLADAVPVAAGDEDVEVRLRPAAWPVVTVLDAAGAPVPGIEIALHVPGEEPYPTARNAERRRVTDARGRARFGGLDPEQALVLTVEPPYDREDLEEVEIEEWLPEDTTIRLAAVRTLSGLVRDRDGYGVGNATLFYREAGSTEAEWTRIQVNDNGSFEAEEVPAGAVELRAGTPWREPDEEGLVTREVGPDEDRVEIEIDGGRWIGLAVPDWPKDTEARAYIAFPRGDFILDMPANGRIRFHGLPEGDSYTLYAGPLPGGRMACREVKEIGRDFTVPLAVGKTIEGRILGPEGARIVDLSAYGPRIRLRDLQGELPDPGRYRIEGLPDGEYLVGVFAGVGEKSYSGEVRVKAGESADIELRPWKR